MKEETPSESTEKEEEKPAPKKKGRKTKEKKEEKKESSEEKEETTAEAAPAAETPAQPIKSKKRRLSFGPDKELTQVEVTPEMIEAEEDEMAKNGFETPQPAPVEESYREIEGILSIGSEKNDFCGFVHTTNFLPGEDDAYVAGQMIRRYGLRKGDRIRGLVAPIRGKERFAPLRKIISSHALIPSFVCKSHVCCLFVASSILALISSSSIKVRKFHFEDVRSSSKGPEIIRIHGLISYFLIYQSTVGKAAAL